MLIFPAVWAAVLEDPLVHVGWVVLVVVWVAVLVPPWLRHLRERRAERSVAVFGGRVSSLQRGAQVRYVFGSYDPYRDEGWRGALQENDLSYLPASAYDDIAPADDAYDALPRPGAAYGEVDGSWDAIYDDDRPYGDDAVDAEDEDLADVQLLPPARARFGADGVTAVMRRSAAGDAEASRTALRRRRQIFFSLVLAFLSSLAAAVVVGSAVVWAVHLVVGVMFVSYVTLLVRHYQRVTERSTKVHRLAARGDVQGGRPSVAVSSGGSGR